MNHATKTVFWLNADGSVHHQGKFKPNEASECTPEHPVLIVLQAEDGSIVGVELYNTQAMQMMIDDQDTVVLIKGQHVSA